MESVCVWMCLCVWVGVSVCVCECVCADQAWASSPDEYTSSTKSSRVKSSIESGNFFKKSSRVKSRSGVLRAVRDIEYIE